MKAKQVITKAILSATPGSKICPLSLMLLDFQMPRMTGLEVIVGLRKFLLEVSASAGVVVEAPKLVILTAFASKNLVTHLASQNIKDCFEKPLSVE